MRPQRVQTLATLTGLAVTVDTPTETSGQGVPVPRAAKEHALSSLGETQHMPALNGLRLRTR
jgi:hypothetical protein